MKDHDIEKELKERAARVKALQAELIDISNRLADPNLAPEEEKKLQTDYDKTDREAARLIREFDFPFFMKGARPAEGWASAEALIKLHGTMGLWLDEASKSMVRNSIIKHNLDKAWAAALTNRLRDALAARIEKNIAPEHGADVADALTGWAEQCRIENAAEWLAKKGWTSIEADRATFARVQKLWIDRNKTGELGEKINIICMAPDVLDPQREKKDAPYFEMWPAIAQGEPLPVAAPDVTPLDGWESLKKLFELASWGQLAKHSKPNPDGKGTWFDALAYLYAKDQAEQEKTRAAAVPFFAIREKAETAAGKWTPLPRVLDIAAALGGPLEVAGEAYFQEPDLAPAAVGRALRPRSLDIIPAAWINNPAQMTLALDMNAPPDALREWMIETAAKTARLAEFPKLCPKMLGFMFAAAPTSGRMVKGSLQDLTRLLFPDWRDRRQNKKDFERVGAAFIALKHLRLMEEKPDGTRHPYELFTMDYDLSTKPDAAVGWMINPWLALRMQSGKGGGFFLLNMTRWLNLGIQNPRLFPLALRLAAQWDRSRQSGIYNPDRLQWMEADRLALECNTLPHGAAMYKQGTNKGATGKAALSKARAEMEADLDALRDAGLLGPWEKRKKYGAGYELKPVPPPDYAEACKLANLNIKRARKKPKPAQK